MFGNNLQAKRGKKGWKFGKYSQHKPNSSFSQILHPYCTFYTHFWWHCQASGFLLVCNYCLKFETPFWKHFKTKTVEKMDKIWKNRASLSSQNISQNLHWYFTLYTWDISCWWATCSWVGATLPSFMPFINSFESI